MKICFKRFQWGQGLAGSQPKARETSVLLCLLSLASAGTSICSTGLKSLFPLLLLQE